MTDKTGVLTSKENALVEGEKFTTAWLNIDKFPGGMMMSSHGGRFGPVPAMTGCLITTSATTVEEWRLKGMSVIEVQLRNAPETVEQRDGPSTCRQEGHDWKVTCSDCGEVRPIPYVHLNSGGHDRDAKIYSVRDVEALLAVGEAMSRHAQKAETGALLCRYCPARFMTAWEHEIHEKEHAQKASESHGPVLTRVCPGCNTVHSGPLCPTESEEVNRG